MFQQSISKIIFAIFLFNLCSFAGSVDRCAESFERLTQLIDRNFFETKRDFEKYSELFPPSFLTRVSTLGRESHWIDAGSGEAFALQDLFNRTVINPDEVIKNAEPSAWRPRKIVIDPKQIKEAAGRLNFRETEDKPKITGIAYKMERPDPQIPNLTIKTGRFFEDIPLEELPQADLITDLYGVISYTPRLDEVLRRYHSLLKDSGRAYLFLGDHLSKTSDESLEEAGWYSPFIKSSVKRADGSVVPLLDWVQALPDFASRVEFVEIQQPPRKGFAPGTIQRSTLLLEKRGSSSNIPRLKLIESDDGKPPTRKFEEVAE